MEDEDGAAAFGCSQARKKRVHARRRRRAREMEMERWRDGEIEWIRSGGLDVA